MVKVLAEALGWSLALGREGLSGLPHHQKTARSGAEKVRSMYPLCPMAVPFFRFYTGKDDQGLIEGYASSPELVDGDNGRPLQIGGKLFTWLEMISAVFLLALGE